MTLSLRPDPWMQWIYDPSHRDYNSDMARDLRECRDRAIRSAPEWMIREAQFNDAMRDAKEQA